MKRSQMLSVLLPLAFVVVVAVSCERLFNDWWGDADQANLEEIETAPEDTTGTQSLTATDEGQVLTDEALGIRIILPERWSQTTGLNDAAVLQAADSEQELYLVVVPEGSEMLMQRDLRENAERYRTLLARRLAVHEGTSPTDVDLIGGDFASQAEIKGELQDGTPVIYLHTTVASGDYYYQIVAWAPPEQYETYRSELQSIVRTFREDD